MEPAAGPGWSGICPAPGGQGGADPGQGSSAAGRASGAQGSWSGAAGGNWITAHPTFTEMMSLDVSDSTQVYAAFLVYLDLLEGRNWHEVQPVGVAELQLVCLHARAREQEGLQVMVPVPAHILISHERLREILKKASLPPEDPDTLLSVTLAIVETDSTIVYYKMTDGFVMPEPPDDTEDVDNKQWRKKRKKLFK
ncbi:tRNA-splicing endonuclease subunit Sen15 [Onychostruthus taczanowskii]|uniref:tRNA-splicing endonuclease subunit Sen15 n=1 Tax=Onychostruthus taczanowskii TaxID=356909 RepID=UPI001B808AB1|nr:tRNA-splicing endonuclease subunit Sen15 [Onychostruthus taczanowskii]